MSNSGFLLTDAGLADASASSPTGPFLHINNFRCGSGFNYSPNRSQTALVGAVLYTGTPLTYTVIDGDTIDVVLQMDNSVGPFDFGEIGLYSNTNVLLAICTFSGLQAKVRAVGSQGGNIWRVHARIKLAQAPVVCIVTVINSSSVLEVPNWQSLAAPQNQLSLANVVIVHEQNASADSILVIREGDLEWATLGYGRIFDGNVSDAGTTSDINGITHPGLANVYLELPQANSRYLIRFSNGDIRRIVDHSGTTNISWNPSLGVAPTGAFSVWEDVTTLNSGFPVASSYEYNVLATSINRFWSTPTGTYFSTNAGLNEVAIPLLYSRPTMVQWRIITDTLLKLLQLLANVITPDQVQYADIVYSDFVSKPNNPSVPGVATLTTLYAKYLKCIQELDLRRNTTNYTYVENLVVPGSQRTRSVPFSSTVDYGVTLVHGTDGARDGVANAGGGYVIVSTSNTSNTFYSAWNSFFNAIGVVVISRGATTSTNGFGTPSAIGILNATGDGVLVYQASKYDAGLASTLYYRVYAARIAGGNGQFNFTVQLQIVGSVTYSYTTPGFMTHTVSMNRAAAALINNPVQALPSVYIGGTFA
jgi:hypothetical protein